MANLLDLAELTGHKSISDMTEAELHEHLREIRVSRRQTKSSDARMSERPEEGKEKKPRAKAKKEQNLEDLSPEQLEALIAKLGGGS